MMSQAKLFSGAATAFSGEANSHASLGTSRERQLAPAAKSRISIRSSP